MNIISKIKKFFRDRIKKEDVQFEETKYGEIENRIVYCSDYINNTIFMNLVYSISFNINNSDSLNSFSDFTNILTNFGCKYITKVVDDRLFCLLQITGYTINTKMKMIKYKDNINNKFMSLLINDIYNTLPVYNQYITDLPFEDRSPYIKTPQKYVLNDADILNMDNPTNFEYDLSIFTIEELLSLCTIDIALIKTEKTDINSKSYIVRNSISRISIKVNNDKYFNIYKLFVTDYFRILINITEDDSNMIYLYNFIRNNKYFNIKYHDVINNNDVDINIMNLMYNYSTIYDVAHNNDPSLYDTVDEEIE